MPNRANTRQHSKHKTKYEVQAKRTEANKLARVAKRLKRIAQAKANPKPVSVAERTRPANHQLHQAMLEDHIARKTAAKEAHHKKLHKRKAVPIQLI